MKKSSYQSKSKKIHIGDNLSEILRRLMKYYDVCSSELAADTNVSKDLIDGWLTGEYPTDPKAVKRVADALGVSTRTLNQATRVGTTQATSKKLETKYQSHMVAAVTIWT
jgi:ribosome-binding protein aMBF1 (putative translation factor)